MRRVSNDAATTTTTTAMIKDDDDVDDDDGDDDHGYDDDDDDEDASTTSTTNDANDFLCRPFTSVLAPVREREWKLVTGQRVRAMPQRDPTRLMLEGEKSPRQRKKCATQGCERRALAGPNSTLCKACAKKDAGEEPRAAIASEIVKGGKTKPRGRAQCREPKCIKNEEGRDGYCTQCAMKYREASRVAICSLDDWDDAMAGSSDLGPMGGDPSRECSRCGAIHFDGERVGTHFTTYFTFLLAGV